MLKIAEIVDEHPPQATTIALADLQIDLVERRVRRNGKSLAIKPRSFDLLCFLIERYPAIASQREIMAGVWPGIVVSIDALTQRVKLLRTQLGESSGDRYVATIHGRGYRLAVAPRAVAPDAIDVAPQTAERRGAALPRAVVVAAFGAILAFGVAAGALLFYDGPHTLKHALKHRATWGGESR